MPVERSAIDRYLWSDEDDSCRQSQSTIACALEQHLLHLRKFSYRLDGDNIRFGLNKDLGFDEKSRNENIRRIGEVCCLSDDRTSFRPQVSDSNRTYLQVAKLFTDACAITITAFISPYISDRALVRELHEKASLGFVEVFVDAPLDVVEQRDPKGLYKKARTGEIKGATALTLTVGPCASTSHDNLASSRIHRRLCPI